MLDDEQDLGRGAARDERGRFRALDPAEVQSECNHQWQRAGYNPEYGVLYECSRCGGMTP